MSISSEAFSVFLEAGSSDALGSSCTIGGVQCVAVFSSVKSDNGFSEFSSKDRRTVSCAVTKDQLQTRPANRAAVVHDGMNYVIEAVEDGAIHYVLTLANRV